MQTNCVDSREESFIIDLGETPDVARDTTVLGLFERGLAKAGEMGRRQVLRLLGVGVSSAILATGPGCSDDNNNNNNNGGQSSATVFRLSTHGQRVCHACKANGANRFFQTSEAADGGRAHPGCNCKIVTQRIRRGVAQQYFRDGPVFDKRQR